jgi:molybdopterin-guanine dinucleotide biosynthesis protein A
VPDILDERSGLGGLYSALLMATTPVVLVLAGDMPFLQPSLLSRLASVGDNADAVVPRTGGRWHPLCAGYRRNVAPLVKLQLDSGSLRVTDAVERMRVDELGAEDLASFDPDGILLMNLNTPGDYERACQLARHHA